MFLISILYIKMFNFFLLKDEYLIAEDCKAFFLQ